MSSLSKILNKQTARLNWRIYESKQSLHLS